MSYKKELDKMTFSYSRIHSYEQCPYSFYLKYIEERCGSGNWWAENGKLIHKTLEMYFKKELTIEEITEYYIKNYKSIEYVTKSSTMDKGYYDCCKFLSEFDFDWFDNYEIIGIEDKCDFMVDKYKFRGFIDLVIKDKNEDKITVLDFKSSQFPEKVKGGILKSCMNNFESYKKQMYLYCKDIYTKYGSYPSEITWLHFRDSKFYTIPFNQEEYNNSILWAEDTIKKIYKDKTFVANKDFIQCQRLCDFRYTCEYNIEE